MITRRTLLALLPAAFATPASASEHPSVTFMNKVGEELLHAHRLGTASALARVIQRYADVTAIGDASIGDSQIPSGDENRYYHGVVNYISRVMASEGQNYPVAKYEVGDAAVDHDQNVVVSSKVYLMAGQEYNISWKLNWSDGSYKVADATVLGFSLVNREKSLFASFISKYGVKALVDRLETFR
jgi:ABC-type transporter MlaC component